jgi:hypothetical protein
MGIMRNAVANVSAGWWAMDLAGKLTDVILFFFFLFVGFFPSSLEEGATDELEHSATPPRGSG